MAKKRGKIEKAVANQTRLQRYMINANLVLRLFITIVTVIVLLAIIGFFLGAFSPQEFARGNVAVIPIKGLIVSELRGGQFEPGGTSAVDTVEAIREANEDQMIEAIIFEINSPGGAAVASDEIVQAIRKVNKTTVAVIKDIGTSGAYWIASATDIIFANEISMTGSIGVIGSYLEIAELLQEYNVTYRRIVAGKYKDIGSPFKELTGEEQLIFQRTVDKMRDYFVKSVAENRNMEVKDVDKLATGAFYLGSEAIDKGLVDEIGSFYDAVSYVETKHNITAELVEFWTRPSLFERLAGVVNINSFFVGKGIGSSLTENPGQVKVWT
jgi:protease-4